jgi:hypothetical protein
MASLALSAAPAASPSRKAYWAGMVLSVLPSLFLLFDTGLHLFRSPMAVEGTVKLGYPASMLLPIGIIQLVALILYWAPRTSALGALVWTGYLGGAVATHVRAGDPLFSHILFPIYFAAMLWAGLCLRDPAVRAVLPFKRR